MTVMLKSQINLLTVKHLNNLQEKSSFLQIFFLQLLQATHFSQNKLFKL